MPPKKSVSASKTPPVAATAPSKSGRQRLLTNKQQQLRIFLDFISPCFSVTNSLHFLVAQQNEKQDATQQRALTDAIRSEQRMEEMNGFRKRKLLGNVHLMIFFDIALIS